MKRWLFGLTLLLPSVALAEPPAPEPADTVDERPLDATEPPAQVTHWTDAHPAASFALVAWVQKNPESARQFFWWDRRHPLRAQYFMKWALEHPSSTIDEFETAHQAWPAIDLVLKPNREALDGLLVWARAHPTAVQDLVSVRRGFAWVGFHPLRPLWSKTGDAPTPSVQ